MVDKARHVFLREAFTAAGFDAVCFFYRDDVIRAYEEMTPLRRLFSGWGNAASGQPIVEEIGRYLERSGFEQGRDYYRVNLAHYRRDDGQLVRRSLIEIIGTQAVALCLEKALFDGVSAGDRPHVAESFEELAKHATGKDMATLAREAGYS